MICDRITSDGSSLVDNPQPVTMQGEEYEEPPRRSRMPVSSEQRESSDNGGAVSADPNGRNSKTVADVATSTHDFPSDEGGGFCKKWTTIKMWSTEKLDEIGQDEVDAEVEELCKKLMKESLLYAHPKHKIGESDIYLWKLCDEYIKKNGQMLVRVFTCPMWYRYRCDAEIRIMEGPDGLILQRTGVHNPFSHTDPDDSGPVTRFICGKKLIPEHEIPEAVAIRISLGQPHPKIRPIRTAVMQHRISSLHRGSVYKYVEDDAPPAIDSDDVDDMGSDEPPDLETSGDDDEEPIRMNVTGITRHPYPVHDNHAGFGKFFKSSHEEESLSDDHPGEVRLMIM